MVTRCQARCDLGLIEYLYMKQYNIIIFIAILIVFTSCDTGGEDDGTVFNWFMALFCLLAWLKGGNIYWVN